MDRNAGSGEKSADGWIFADIGGTWARFAHWRPGVGAGPVARWPADRFESFGAALEAYQCSLPMRVPRAAIAIATQLRDTRIRMTNRHWTFDARDLHAATGLDTLLLVNDFAGAAAGLPALVGDEAGVVRAAPGLAGHWLLIGPGTGLGAAALFGVGSTRERVLASEAGHMGFAASEAALDGLRDLALQRWPRVSWERILSGNGLSLLHAWQSRLARDAVQADGRRVPGTETDATMLPAAQISALVAAGDPVARATARWFSRLLGSFAGDLCLAFGIDGGLWLTGGVLDGIGSGFDTAAFLDAFDDKGRYAARQRTVPVRRVQVADLAFRGLARIVSGACAVPALLVTAQGVREVDGLPEVPLDGLSGGSF